MLDLDPLIHVFDELDGTDLVEAGDDLVPLLRVLLGVLAMHQLDGAQVVLNAQAFE